MTGVSFTTSAKNWCQETLLRRWARTPSSNSSMYGIYLLPFTINNQPKNVGKYTSPMDGMGRDMDDHPTNQPFFRKPGKSLRRRVLKTRSSAKNFSPNSDAIVASNGLCTTQSWVVKLQTFFSFTPTWGRFPFWLIFFRWVETTN